MTPHVREPCSCSHVFAHASRASCTRELLTFLKCRSIVVSGDIGSGPVLVCRATGKDPESISHFSASLSALDTRIVERVPLSSACSL